MPKKGDKRPLLERFEEKYVPVTESGCWIWIACLRNGYGTMKVNGKMIKSNRLAWTLCRGPIPKGLFVLHTCDVKECVNPDHLFLGTHGDNMKDMVKKGRSAKCVGENHSQTTLTNKQVLAIRDDSRVQHIVAKDYGIKQQAVSNIKLRKTWQHI
jgi:hypothetical protein